MNLDKFIVNSDLSVLTELLVQTRLILDQCLIRTIFRIDVEENWIWSLFFAIQGKIETIETSKPENCGAKPKGSICLHYKWSDIAFWHCRVIALSPYFFLATGLYLQSRCYMGHSYEWQIPEDTRRWINVGLTLVQRRRRWTNVKPTLIQSLVSTGIGHFDC